MLGEKLEIQGKVELSANGSEAEPYSFSSMGRRLCQNCLKTRYL